MCPFQYNILVFSGDLINYEVYPSELYVSGIEVSTTTMKLAWQCLVLAVTGRCVVILTAFSCITDIPISRIKASVSKTITLEDHHLLGLTLYNEAQSNFGSRVTFQVEPKPPSKMHEVRQEPI